MRGSNNRKVIPHRFNGEAVVSVESFDEGLPLCENRLKKRMPADGVIERAKALNGPIASKVWDATPCAGDRTTNRVRVAVTRDTYTWTKVNKLKEFDTDTSSERQASDKHELSRVDDKDGPSSILSSKVDIESELAEEISPTLMSEQIHL